MVFTLALGKDGAVDAYREENQRLADQMAELGSVAARKATLLNPTEEDETAPVLRRRLFKSIEEPRVDEVVAARRELQKEITADLAANGWQDRARASSSPQNSKSGCGEVGRTSPRFSNPANRSCAK